MSSQNDSGQPQPFDTLRSITRLVVGGVILGGEAFLQYLRVWEEKTSPAIGTTVESAPDAGGATSSMPGEANPAAVGQTTTDAHLLPESVKAEGDILDAQFKEVIEGEVLEASQGWAAGPSSDAQKLGYALVGATFAASEGLRRGASMVGRLGRATDRFTRPIVRPLQKSRIMRPARRGFENLVRRGEQELAGWIETGQRETSHSRQLAQTALITTVDETIEYLSKNEEIQELITTQSTGLATEMVEEVRERTVSADTFVEGMLRAILRLPPRSSLPEPPEEVRKQAISFRDLRKQRLEQLKK